MASNWPPLKDQLLGNYAPIFAAKVAAELAALGLSSGDSTLLTTLKNNFVAALAVCNDPETHTRSATIGKNTSKGLLLLEMRSIGKRIKANPAVTAEMKADLGIPLVDGVVS